LFTEDAYFEDFLGWGDNLLGFKVGLEDIISVNTSSNNVAQLEQLYLNYLGDNLSNLEEDEVILAEVMIDVAIYSTKQWAPADIGGDNGHTRFINASLLVCDSEDLPLASINWGNFVVKDFAGAVASAGTSLLLTGGASAVPCPPLFIPKAGYAGVIGGAISSLNTLW